MYYSLWRRLFSPIVVSLLCLFYGVRLSKELVLVGLPSIQGKQITIGKGSVLVSARLGNPIGLFRACILGTAFDENGIEGEIVIGDNFSASGVCIYAMSRVSIGNNVMIGANVTILDTDFHPIHKQERLSKGASSSIPVIIGNDVWIGMNAVILKGVSIGDGAVIGANCVVAKDIPENATVVGGSIRVFNNED